MGPPSVVGSEAVEWILESLLRNQSLSNYVNDTKLFLLLLGIIEGLSCRYLPKSNSQLSSYLCLLRQFNELIEEFIKSWCQFRNSTQNDTNYMGVALFIRYLLRVWLTLVNNSTSSFLSPGHISELQKVLPRPIAMITKVITNLRRDIPNCYADNEFTFLFLESLYVSITCINNFVDNPLVSCEVFLGTLNECLFDSSQEWLLYVCSKLQSTSRNSAHWDVVIDSAHLLLGRLTRELVITSDHIHSCRKVSKSHLLMMEDDGRGDSASLSSAPRLSVSYSLETSIGFDKMEQRLCKISQSVLSIFDTIPNIQLLALQLLAQTGLDKVGIISDFLPRVSHSSVWSMPEVLDLYLELLEKAWLQLSPDFSGTSEFWSKVSHYATPLLEGSWQTILQVLFHLLFLFSHRSYHLISALTQHVILQYHFHVIKNITTKVSEAREKMGVVVESRRSLVNISFEIEEEKVIHLYLKLLQKMSSHPSSLVPFLDGSPTNLFSLFLFLPIVQFRLETLGIFCSVLHTLCVPWEASVTNSNRLSDTKVHLHLVNSLLHIAYGFHEANLVNRCDKLAANGGSNMSSFDLVKINEVHVMIQNLLDNSQISFLVKPSLVQHLALISDVWKLLVEATSTCEGIITLVNNNHIWDVIQVLAPSLASLLDRVRSMQEEGEEGGINEGVELENEGVVKEEVESGIKGVAKEEVESIHLCRLQEVCVSLLCHLLSMATIVCRVREQPLKVYIMLILCPFLVLLDVVPIFITCILFFFSA